MLVSRRTALRIGSALTVAPWVGHVSAAARAPQTLVPTGSRRLDAALGGGIRTGSLIVIVDLAGGAKSSMLTRMAQANGVLEVHAMSSGSIDMLSLMQRADGLRMGCLVLSGPEPATTTEQADMQRHPKARDAFLTRWFKRAREVAHESGGIMAIGVQASADDTQDWMAIPAYAVSADERVIKMNTWSTGGDLR